MKQLILCVSKKAEKERDYKSTDLENDSFNLME